MDKRKESISFRGSLADGADVWLQERVKENGTIEGVRVRFYSGQELSLKVSIFLEKKGEVPVSLISFASTTDTYISGDDDYFVFPVVVPVKYDDHVKVYVENDNGDGFAYHYAVDVDIDYYGGQRRIVGGVYGG